MVYITETTPMHHQTSTEVPDQKSPVMDCDCDCDYDRVSSETPSPSQGFRSAPYPTASTTCRPQTNQTQIRIRVYQRQLIFITESINQGVDVMLQGEYSAANEIFSTILQTLRKLIRRSSSPNDADQPVDVEVFGIETPLITLDDAIAPASIFSYRQARRVVLTTPFASISHDDSSCNQELICKQMQTNLHSLSSILVYNIGLMFHDRAMCSQCPRDQRTPLLQRAKTLYKRSQQLFAASGSKEWQSDPARMLGIWNNLAHVSFCLDDIRDAYLCCHRVYFLLSSWTAAADATTETADSFGSSDATSASSSRSPQSAASAATQTGSEMIHTIDDPTDEDDGGIHHRTGTGTVRSNSQLMQSDFFHGSASAILECIGIRPTTDTDGSIELTTASDLLPSLAPAA